MVQWLSQSIVVGASATDDAGGSYRPDSAYGGGTKPAASAHISPAAIGTMQLRMLHWYVLALNKLPAGSDMSIRYRAAKLQAEP